jgi:hypothetical protein
MMKDAAQRRSWTFYEAVNPLIKLKADTARREYPAGSETFVKRII